MQRSRQHTAGAHPSVADIVLGGSVSGLSFSLLGQFAITVDDKPFDGLRLRPAVALCVYLVCRPERHRREHLMALLWPDWPPAAAQQNLRQNLYVLRQTFPEVAARVGRGPGPFLLSDRGTVQLNPEADVFVDATRFSQLLAQPQPSPIQLAEAVNLYQGDFLADFYLPGSEPFEEWAAAWRADLRRRMLDALASLAAGALERGEYSEAMTYARRQMALDNLHENAHRQFMVALAHSGQRVSALAHYEACRRLIRDELGVEPSAETRALAERIASGEERPTAVTHSPQTINKPHHSLPAQMTSFIGRRHEITEVIALLRRPNVRLLTLTGVGGTGKTRLALQTAEFLTADFADGVWFIRLEAIIDPAQVIPEICRALGINVRPTDSAANTLRGFLRDRQVLLILDNFEQVLDAAQDLNDLLQFTAGVKALVTSRASLRLYGEKEYPVPPLNLPIEETTSETLKGVESVDLFVRRAQAVRPDFRLTDSNAPIVAAICRRLDGLPLALELAASRLRLFTPQQLLDRLNSRLNALGSGSRAAANRQQSLRATIDWSYDMLEPVDRLLFARLSIFAGGWTLEAADAICADERCSDLVAGLESLLEKNLIRTIEEESQMRFAMLETIREYAAEKMAESEEMVSIADRHAVYYCALATSISYINAETFKILGSELENLDRAAEYLLATGRFDDMVRIYDKSFSLWGGGLRTLSEDRLQRLLQMDDASDWARAWSLNWLALTNLGNIGPFDLEAAEALLNRAEQLARQGDFDDVLADVLTWQGRIANWKFNDLRMADRKWLEALDASRRSGHEDTEAMVLNNLANTALILNNDYDKMRQLAQASSDLFRRLGLEYETPEFLLALSDLHDGETNQMRLRLLEITAMLEARPGPRYIPNTANILLLWGLHASATARHAKMVRLQSRVTDIVPPQYWLANPIEKQFAWEALNAARRALGDEAFAIAWADGQRMSLEEAVAYALEE
jgi:predicted ATPase/DNA-binding SARP family transcriptional activator